MVRLESELIPTISNGKAKLGNYDDVAYEITSGYGIADVVFYTLNDETIKKRVNDTNRTIAESHLLRALVELSGKKPGSTVGITTMQRWSSRLKNDTLQYLLERGYLIEENISGKARYKVGRKYENGIKESVAVEAKIKDWKRGLYQAYRYKRYADKSYLAVYSPYINPPLKNLDKFKKYNVGLIEVTDHNVRVHFHPLRKNKPDSFMKAVAYENLLAQRLHTVPHI